MEPISFPEISVTNKQSKLCNIPKSEDLIYTAVETWNEDLCVFWWFLL
jgi:hypothetical protein